VATAAAGATDVVRTEPHARPPAPGDRRLSVVIPAYREGERITAAIERVRTELAPHVAASDLEIVVVDDGSGDGTAEAAAGADLVLVHGVNRGKGAAVRTGMLAACGRTRVFTDADLSYAPAQIVRLLHEVEAGWDIVVGNRYHEDTTTTVPASALREVGGRLVNGATRLVLLGTPTATRSAVSRRSVPTWPTWSSRCHASTGSRSTSRCSCSPSGTACRCSRSRSSWRTPPAPRCGWCETPRCCWSTWPASAPRWRTPGGRYRADWPS
jgi:hypothetical protein